MKQYETVRRGVFLCVSVKEIVAGAEGRIGTLPSVSPRRHQTLLSRYCVSFIRFHTLSCFFVPVRTFSNLFGLFITFSYFSYLFILSHTCPYTFSNLFIRSFKNMRSTITSASTGTSASTRTFLNLREPSYALSQTFSNFLRLSQTFANLLQPPPTSSDFLRLPRASSNFLQLPPTFSYHLHSPGSSITWLQGLLGHKKLGY